MGNKAYDSYGYSLQEFLNKAIAEGRTDYAEVFNDALIKAAEGDPTLASHICKTIANYDTVDGVEGVDIFRISLKEYNIQHTCDVNNPQGCM